MTIKEKECVKELMQTARLPRNEANVCRIKEEFIKSFSVDIVKNPYYVYQLLERAYIEKNATDLDYAFIIEGNFNLFAKEFPDEYPGLLLKILGEDWHFKHEDIVWTLQQLKLPEAVDALYETTLKRFKYLDFDDAHALAVKCIWALGEIRTEKSREKLKLLSQSENQIIKNNAIMQLERQ